MKKIIIFSIIFISLILWLEFFLKSGFYMFLDTIFFPVYNFWNFFNKSLYLLISDFFIYFLWYEIYSKIFLLLVLISWAYLWYISSKYILEKFDIKNEKLNIIIPIISIVFSISNPFIYERLVTQLWIAFWVIVFWIWFINILKFLDSAKIKYLYLSVIFLWFSFNIFPHIVVFLIILWFFLLLFFIKKFNFKNILLSIIIVFLLNFNWLFGNYFINSENNTIKTIQTFNFQNLEVFKQNEISNLWVELTTWLLYWFWWELWNRIITPDLLNKYWFIFGFLVLFIILFWIFNLYKKDKKLTLFLVSILIVSYVLSLWVSSQLFLNLNKFLYENIPYYIWMREPAKLLWIVSIVYLLFFLSWNLFLIEKIKYIFKKYDIELHYLLQNYYFYALLILILILSWSPSMLFGFNWQLRIIKYPEEYLNSRNILIENQLNKTLILPWHAYMWCNYNLWRVISNPLPWIINFKNTVSAENLEMNNLYSNIENELTNDVETFIKNYDINLLKKHNIDSIVFQKNCWNFKIYDFLYKSKSLEIINSKDQLDIFLIK